jgi:hypothetical protein
MSYDDGWAALNLEMPPRVPRTEYSVMGHWPLISRVTGIPVHETSPEDLRRRAVSEFIGSRHWNLDLHWSILASSQEFGAVKTQMGHAAYAAGGVDFQPQVHTLMDTPELVLAFDPWERLGPREPATLVQRFEDHYRRNCESRPDGVNMTGVYVTCVSGLIDLFGWDMLLTAAGTDPEAFGALTHRYASWVQQYFDAMGNSKVPVVMVHDDIVWTEGPFIHPDWYRTYVFPNYRKLFRPLIDSGKKILFTSDGNYTAFIDDIVACGVHGLVMEPSTDMKQVAQKYGRTHVFIGNADTRALLLGPREAIRSEVERCMSIGKSCPGFFIAVGNHIPANTPVENCLYYNELYEKLGRR